MTERKRENRVTVDQYRRASDHDFGESGRAGKARLPIVSLIGAVLPLALVVGCTPGAPVRVQGTTSQANPTTAASPTTQSTITSGNSSSGGGSTSSSVQLFCKILQTNGLQYDVTTNGGTYNGAITVSFQDDSGHTFDPVHLTSASTDADWQNVPDSDIGASVQPTKCTATAG